MRLISPGGGGGSVEPALGSIGTTRFHVYPATSSEATSSEDSEPQLQADVTGGSSGGSVTVEWSLGGTVVAERSKTLDAFESATLARRVAWSELQADGLVPGDYPLKATLKNTGESTTYGTMHLHEQQGAPTPTPTPGDGDDDTSGSAPPAPSTPGTLLPAGFPTLPAVGPLTAEQTTLGALVVVVVLVVVGR